MGENDLEGRLLDEIDRSIKAKLFTDDDGDDELNKFLSLVALTIE